MHSADTFENFPVSLATKMRAFAEQTAAKAYNICKRNHVPQDVYEAFILDAIDIMRAQYRGLRATTEQMQILTDCVKHSSWGRTENAALCFIAKYYDDIAKHINGALPVGYIGFINAVVICEVSKRVRDDMIVHFDTSVMNEMRTEAQRLYYTYAVLIAAEFCDATEDELRGIEPHGVTLTEQQKPRAIAAGLYFQMQRQRKASARSTRTAMRGDSPEMGGEDTGGLFDTPKTLPQLLPADKTILHYQNFAYMQSNGMQTADNLPDNRSGKMRPIWQGIAEQRRQALAIMDDAQATDAEKVRAAELAADTYAVAQVMDAIQILPQLIKPISGSNEYSEYITTPREFYRIATGIDSPNNEQILRFLKALAWVDTQRISVAEMTEKTITERDSSGVIVMGEDGKPKRRKVQRSIVTNFRPVVVTFRTEYEDKVPIAEATRLNIMLHKIVKDGRSGEFVERDGKRMYIVAPAQHYMKIEQYYQFTTEEERTFRAIIQSKGQQAEDALLSAVFNYPQRQAEADARAADARRIADELQRNPEATDAQKQQAQADAAAAQDNARYLKSKNMGRDYDKLAGMFEKAQNCGLISYYTRRAAAAGGVYKQNKYGRGFVWVWGNNSEAGQTKRGRRRKA